MTEPQKNEPNPEDREYPEEYAGRPFRLCGEHRSVGPHRAWCFDCHEWCYPHASTCLGCGGGEFTDSARLAQMERLLIQLQLKKVTAERDALKARVTATLKLVLQSSRGVKCSPPDCTNACDDGDCDCSGLPWAAAWILDPDAVRATLLGESANTTPPAFSPSDDITQEGKRP